MDKLNLLLSASSILFTSSGFQGLCTEFLTVLCNNIALFLLLRRKGWFYKCGLLLERLMWVRFIIWSMTKRVWSFLGKRKRPN